MTPSFSRSRSRSRSRSSSLPVLSIFLCLTFLPRLAAAPPADSPELLLEEGFYLEAALADPDAAIRVYERILAAGSLPPRIAARAQLRLGLCLEVLGRLDAAREQFEAVASSPGAEARAVKTARRRLGEATLDEPASFMPEDVFVYTELVNPPERVQELAALLEGTPFENPVDYYATYLGRSGAPRRDPPAAGDLGDVRQAAALFNEGFLRELRKVEGFAIAVPGDAKSEREFIAVLFPGASDIIRGFIRMALTISNAKPLGQVRGVPIFETREPPAKEGAEPEQMCFALGREVILFGRPARLIEDAIERQASSSPSLAGTAAFREARSSREGSLLFTHVGHERLLELLRRLAKPEDRQGFALLEAVLGTKSLHSLSLTVSWMRSSDSLGLGMRARFASGLPALWSALATPAKGSGAIPAVPPGSPGYLALRLDRGRERWARLREALAPVFDELEKKGDHGLELVHASFAEEPGQSLLDALDALVIGVAESGPEGKAKRFASLHLGSRSAPERSALVEGGLSALLGRVFKTRSSSVFEDVELSGSGGEGPLRARFVEPVPGLRIYHAEIAGSEAIATHPEVLEAMRSGSGPELSPPAGAAKAIFLRPSAWAPAEPEGGARDLLRDVPRVWITLREEGDAVVAILQVPEFTTVARAILRRIAETERRRALEENR